MIFKCVLQSDLSSTVGCLSNKIVYRNQIGQKRWLKKTKSKMEATLFIWLYGSCEFD
jgi:hypothetical protein